jgi:hypothetical protein
MDLLEKQMMTYLRTLQRSLQSAPHVQGLGPLHLPLRAALSEAAEAVSADAAVDAEPEAGEARTNGQVAVPGAASSVPADKGQLGQAERAQLSVDDEWKHVVSQVEALCAVEGTGSEREASGQAAGAREVSEAGSRRGSGGGAAVHKGGSKEGARAGSVDESQAHKMRFEIEALTKKVIQKDAELAAGKPRSRRKCPPCRANLRGASIPGAMLAC